MSKVTRKLQISVPKALADRYGITPGDDLTWEAAGDGLRLVPPRSSPKQLGRKGRLRVFDAATARQRTREQATPRVATKDRGWTRAELYNDRGRPR